MLMGEEEGISFVFPSEDAKRGSREEELNKNQEVRRSWVKSQPCSCLVCERQSLRFFDRQ